MSIIVASCSQELVQNRGKVIVIETPHYYQASQLFSNGRIMFSQYILRNSSSSQ